MVAAQKSETSSTSSSSGPAPGPRLFHGDAPSDRAFPPKKIVRPKDEPWGVEYPFESHWFKLPLSVPGSVYLHYVDEGPRDAPVIVFLHGNPTWSFYWRKLITALRGKYRCIAIDHLGCGLSDRPQQWVWSLDNRIGNANALLEELGIQKYSLVVHDWGGAIGFGLATRHPERIEKIVVTNTAAFTSKDIPLSIASCRIPVFGKVAVLGFNAFAWAATFRAVEKPLSSNAKAGLLAPYSNPHDRLATLTFVEDIPMKPSHRSWDTLVGIEKKLNTLVDKPMMLVWGDKDFCFTPKFRARFEKEFPKAAVHAFDDVGHYVNEDAPERIVPLVEKFFG